MWQFSYDFIHDFWQDVRNTIGNVPLKWYDEYDHIGYDVLGKKIAKSKKGDEIDEFLEKNDNPDYWLVYKCFVIFD